VNECEAQRCSQECANIYGSYQCYCRQGYQLAEDGHTCTGTYLPWPARGPHPEALPRVPGSRAPAAVRGCSGHTEASASERRSHPCRAASWHLDRGSPSLTSGAFPAKQR